MDTITNNTSEESIQACKVETSVSEEHNLATDTTTAEKNFEPSESIILEPVLHREPSSSEISTAGVSAIDGEVDTGANTNDTELVSSSGAIDNNAGGEAAVIVVEKQNASEPEQVQLTPAEEPFEPVSPPLPLPDPISDFRGSISAFGFSQQGESHIKKDAPCQDRSSLRFLSDSVVIAAVADGVGSCALSDYGSATAVETSLSYLEKHLGSKLEDPSFTMDVQFMGKVLREMMQHSYDQVRVKADEMEQLLYSLQSTLTVAVYDGKTLYFAHAGDDGIVALTHDGKCEMATTRHKGEEASSVYPLQSRNTWQYGKVDNVVGFIMATDGVLDAFVRNETEGNRVYYPFIEPAFSSPLTGKDDTASACSDWYTYMKTPKYRSSVTDDLSFICIANQDALKRAQKPNFDMGEWNKKTKEYEDRRRAALYPPKSQQVSTNANPPKTDRTVPPASGNPRRPVDDSKQGAASSNSSTSYQTRPYQNPNTSQERSRTPNHPNQSTPPYSMPPRYTPVQPNVPYYGDKAKEYGKKVLKGVGGALEGVGGILLVSGEILLDAGEEAIRAVREYADNSREARSQSQKPTNPSCPKKGNNGGNQNNSKP